MIHNPIGALSNLLFNIIYIISKRMNIKTIHKILSFGNNALYIKLTRQNKESTTLSREVPNVS